MGSPPAVITDCVLWELGAATLAAAEVTLSLVSGEGALGTRTQPPARRRLFPAYGDSLTPTDDVDKLRFLSYF